MLLSDVPQGVTVSVCAIADSELAVRLQELGIRPGQAVTVMHRSGNYAVVVGVGDQRIALASSLASTITTGESSPP
ncbi:MAG: ferrous iron transport protein A [Actinobacteria bacterium HGW-Actinobacteria-4]|nr:MAG: ferrous iron transport protein A [Actinobacteria bacterium HGW-Actinobacteria-4]